MYSIASNMASEPQPNWKFMNYWLMKSEPETFGIDHLKKAPNKTHCWDGVRNYQARNYMRDAMQIGDQAFFYHSNCKTPGIVGIVEIVSASYPDHTAFDPESKYYDPKATSANPRWFMRDIKFIKKLETMISITELRANPGLSNMIILKPGNRLSITPVTAQEWRVINR
jgi:predicted RNA-binding protein with PUA-like domain